MLLLMIGSLFCSVIYSLPLISFHVLLLDPTHTHLEFKPMPIGDPIPITLFGFLTHYLDYPFTRLDS